MNEKNMDVEKKPRCLSQNTFQQRSELALNGNINLRIIKPQEVPVVGDLIRDTIRVSYAVVYPPRAIDFFLSYQTDDSIARRNESGIVIVAECCGKIVATGSLVRNEITGVFVSANFQGKNIGNLVMNKLEAYAAQNGHDHVELSVSLPSRGFYEKRGYKIKRPAKIDVGMAQFLEYWEGVKLLGKKERFQCGDLEMGTKEFKAP